MKITTLILVAVMFASVGEANAQITNIIGDYRTNKGPDTVGVDSNLGNGDFQTDGQSGTRTFEQITGWHNLLGPETQNFGQSSGINGSPQDDDGTPGSLGAMVFRNFIAGNDTNYTIQAADVGVGFNFASYLGQFGAAANYSGDETYNAHLFTSTTGVTADTDWNTDVTILGTATFNPISGFNMVRENGFYTAQAGDVGKSVYLGLEFLNETNPPDVFPRIDVVSLSIGALAPITPLAYEFNAANNPPLANPSDPATVWNPSIDGRSIDPLSPTEAFTFGSTQSANVVNNANFPGITYSYSAGGEGRQTETYGAAAGSSEVSIEVWFKPDSLAGGDQVIAEIGGADNGSYISLQNGTLSFHTNTVSNPNVGSATISAPALTEAEWTQVVANWSPDGDLELFVNGQSAATTSGTALSRWAGGNPAGIGRLSGNIANNGPLGSADEALEGDYNGNGVVDAADYTVWRDNLGADAGTLPNDPNEGLTIGVEQYETWKANFGQQAELLQFAGELAILRVYDEILTAQDVLDSFNAITTASGGGSTSVPEPASLFVVGVLTVLGATRRTRSQISSIELR